MDRVIVHCELMLPRFPVDYVPTVFDNYSATVYQSGQPVMLNLWDTAGQADFDQTRKSSYQGAHVVMICFALNSPVSLKNVESKVFDNAVWFISESLLCGSGIRR